MKTPSIVISLLVSIQLASAQQNFTVDLDNTGHAIQPDMYGVFFEDINFGADGGLYAELIKNRSFEFHQPWVGWLPFGNVQIREESPCFDRNPRYARLTESGLRRGTGLENNGVRGMGFRQNDSYRFSFFASTSDTGEAKFLVELVGSDENVIGREELYVAGTEWKKYQCMVTPGKTDARGKIRILLQSPGSVDLDHISLFPAKTWKDRENGLRMDLVEALYDLRPGVFRFPGGCIIEGNTLDTRYQWKHSVGPVENRPINENRWNYNFEYRFFPDYYQSYGLGYYEYFILSEDLGAEPLPVINCGLACQYESTECVPVEDLGPYIQDAVDLIEFANGPADSKWGRVRAEMGHPEPFHLKYLAIGNEQWGEVYVERLMPFLDVLRKEHPEIKIIGSSGPTPDGERFDYLWPKMKELEVDLVDEHYYRSPEWFLANAARYDTYDRKGPKVFAGEFAAHHETRDNNLRAAIAEAAFMTGLERNADMVHLATYAPLLAHYDAWQWKPDLIWFDNLQVVRTPNYYVQQMFARNPGTHVLQIGSAGEKIIGQDSLYASAVWDNTSREVIIKIVNAGDQVQDIRIDLEGKNNGLDGNTVEIISLHSNHPEAVNTREAPNTIVPVHSSLKTEENSFILRAQGHAFYVCRVSLEREDTHVAKTGVQ